jgi:hypothetical protein
MSMLPIEFLSNNLNEQISITIKRFDRKFYDINGRSFKEESPKPIPLERLTGLHKYIMEIILDVEESEFIPGDYSVYYHDSFGNIVDLSSFKIVQKPEVYPTTTDIAIRVLSSTVGNKNLRDSLKDTNDKVNLIYTSLKEKGVI